MPGCLAFDANGKCTNCANGNNQLIKDSRKRMDYAWKDIKIAKLMMSPIIVLTVEMTIH